MTSMSTRQYMSRAAEGPVLTREGEVELARRIETGRLEILEALALSSLGSEELFVLAFEQEADEKKKRWYSKDTDKSGKHDGAGWSLARVQGSFDIERMSLRRQAEAFSEGILQLRDDKGSGVETGLIERALLRFSRQIYKVGQRANQVEKTCDPRDSEAMALLAETSKTIRRAYAMIQQARDDFARANLRLVVYVANRYAERGLPVVDLIQEGNLGLMKAIDRFDLRSGYRFSTYGVWWIRQAIARAIAEQSRMIRVPVFRIEQLRRVVNARQKLIMTLGRTPTYEEIAKDIGESVETVNGALSTVTEPLSLDAPAGDRDDTDSLRDFVEDSDSPSPQNGILENQMTDRANQALRWLTPREAMVIRKRFGLEDRRTHTLEELGAQIGVTRERVRQIEALALRKLRESPDSEALRSFVGE